MKIYYNNQFDKDLSKICDKIIIKKIFKFISQIEEVDSINEIKNIKKLKGFSIYYRYKIGFFRLGFRYTENKEIIFDRILNRKDIYKKYP